jgi:hypothetical protein
MDGARIVAHLVSGINLLTKGKIPHNRAVAGLSDGLS